MTDNDLEIRRLDNGLTITRTPKPKVLLNNQRRKEYKTKLPNLSGENQWHSKDFSVR